MSDWAAGDLAYRIRYQDSARGTAGAQYTTRLGEIRRVMRVVVVCGEIGLVLQEKPSPHPTGAWSSLQWRKIRPDEHEACETEFVTLLKRSKRRVVA